MPSFCPRCGSPLADKIPPSDLRVRRVCTRCEFVMYLNPKTAAGTLPVRHGKVVLVRRCVEPAVGTWSWPCGYVEVDETVEAAARRETLEECGLSVTLGEMLGVYSYPVPSGQQGLDSTGLIVMAWETTSIEGELAPGDDADAAEWFDLDALPWDDLAFDSTRRALRDFLDRIG